MGCGTRRSRTAERAFRWPVSTLVICAAIAAWLIWTYFPGRASNDVAYQARQALGEIPYSDWHPPVMSALWQSLYEMTGTLGSLLVLQVIFFCSAAWLLSVQVYARTRSRGASLLPILAILMPWSLSQIGILWKDSQMAVAYLLAIAFLFLVRPGRPRTYWLLLPAFMLLIYGTGVRKNALAALLPIAVYVGMLAVTAVRRRRPQLFRRPVVRWIAAGAAGTLGFLVVVGAVAVWDRSVAAAHNVQASGQSTQIMLDDVLFSIPPAELENSSAGAGFKEHAARAREKCARMGETRDAYWNCWGRGETGEMYSPLSASDTATIQELWKHDVITHPGRYLQYRWTVYCYYLTSSRLVYWKVSWTGSSNQVGLGSVHAAADAPLAFYVRDIGAHALGVTFLPLFWLLSGAAAGVAARWSSRFRAQTTVLASSAVVYILAYFPVVPANHFRYTYWPALAVTVAWGLLIASRLATRRERVAVRNDGGDAPDAQLSREPTSSPRERQPGRS